MTAFVHGRIIAACILTSAVAAITALSPKSPPAARAADANVAAPAVAEPSKLDYVVLASLADTGNLMALSAYGKPPASRAAKEIKIAVANSNHG